MMQRVRHSKIFMRLAISIKDHFLHCILSNVPFTKYELVVPEVALGGVDKDGSNVFGQEESFVVEF